MFYESHGTDEVWQWLEIIEILPYKNGYYDELLTNGHRPVHSKLNRCFKTADEAIQALIDCGYGNEQIRRDYPSRVEWWPRSGNFEYGHKYVLAGFDRVEE